MSFRLFLKIKLYTLTFHQQWQIFLPIFFYLFVNFLWHQSLHSYESIFRNVWHWRGKNITNWGFYVHLLISFRYHWGGKMFRFDVSEKFLIYMMNVSLKLTIIESISSSSFYWEKLYLKLSSLNLMKLSVSFISR